MVTIVRVHLPSDVPIVGCELTPYLLVRRGDGSVSPADHILATAPIDGCFLKYIWYRIESEKRVAVCNVHPTETAKVQCIKCLQLRAIARSYHCSEKCYVDSWKHHKFIHARGANSLQENRPEEEDIYGSFTSGTRIGLSSGLIPVLAAGQGEEGETWYEVGWSRTYTPSADDIGHLLKLECTVIESSTGQLVAPSSGICTSRVIPAPSPIPRQMVPVTSVHGQSSIDPGSHIHTAGTFTVLSYNVLADIFTSHTIYSYCPQWALTWTYRRQNLLREIVGYRADIVCLQEVQHDHFENFFLPELDKYGYAAVYKKKTNEVFVGTAYTNDGCATFFRRESFSQVKKYEVEFSKAAQALTEGAIAPSQRKTALGRLLKDNVALIVVLEARDAFYGGETTSVPGKNQLICVANTHIHANPELKDVKLWQVHTLLKGLEKIAASADIPMLVCGDFNSLPGSAAHLLLKNGRVDPSHPDLDYDPLGILRPTSKLFHNLPLSSAYSSLMKSEEHRCRMNPASKEPLFTNFTRDFTGTIDYIFYTNDSLTVESLLELPDVEDLRRDTALPSTEWSSDHIALLAQFRYKHRSIR